MMRLADAIPVSILTGFLGAGKSTLLNRLLKAPDMADTAVIINEFGEVGIDHLLVEASGDSVVELSNGCVCCTVRGELSDTLLYFRDRIADGRLKSLKRIVIETTGLADPAPVLQSIIGHPELSSWFSIDGVITVVDAVNGRATLEKYDEAMRQVAFADRLVLSKRALASQQDIDRLVETLHAINPRALLIDGDAVEAASRATFSAGLWDPASKTADVERWLQEERRHDHICGDGCNHDHHHGHRHHDHKHRHDGINSFSIVHDRPIAPQALSMFIDLLRSAHGENLLRMKAVVQLSDDPDRPLILHGVQTIFHTPERLASWPGPDHRTRLVMITTRALSEDFVQSLFDAFTGKVSIDRPDRQALEDNPLSIPGMKF